MAFKMGVSKDKLEGNKPLPAGVYDIQIGGFEPKLSKNKDSINLNPIFKVVNNPELAGQRVFWNCNTKAAWLWNDFCHCFGLPVEFEAGDNGTEEAVLPGGSAAWQEDPSDPENIEKAKYVGPLNGLVGKVEVVIEHQPGQKPRNSIKMFICAIDGCAQKYPDISHSTNMLK